MRYRTLAFLAVALIAAGAALLVASYAPRQATAVWVGGGSHAAIFLHDRDNQRYQLSSAVITRPEVAR